MQKEDKGILVMLHLFYMNDWEEIQKYLANLKKYPFDFWVTYMEEYKDEYTLKKIRETYTNVQFLECKNKGFDVGPFFECLQYVDLDKYDIVYKIHSKGRTNKCRYIYKQLFKKDDWFKYLYESVLGKHTTDKVVQILRNDEKVGLIAAKNLIISDPIHKVNLTNKWASKLQIGGTNKYHYVAGTCFAVKAKALKSIKEWKIRLEDFEDTRRGRFSLAHALERLICIDIERQGYRLKGINVCNIRQIIRKLQACFITKSNSDKLQKDTRFTIDDEFFYFVLEPRHIEKYEITSVKLKDIKRVWEGKAYNLEQCAPYEYLLETSSEKYEDYCLKNAPISPSDMSTDRYNQLIDSIDKRGFDEKWLPIINYDNVVLDGQHRLCILLKKYGPEYEARVLRIKFKQVVPTKWDYKDLLKIRRLSKKHKLYIYGAGIIGERCYKFLGKKGISVEGFVVTKATDNQKYMNEKVYSIDDIQDKSVGFILALNEKNKGEVKEELKQREFHNYFMF